MFSEISQLCFVDSQEVE